MKDWFELSTLECLKVGKGVCPSFLLTAKSGGKPPQSAVSEI
jgi:hypothetical protein